jgi:hypothetical protein
MIELGGVGHLALPFVGGVGGGRLYVVLVVGAVLVVMGGGEVQRLPGSSPMRAARATQQQGGLLMAHLSPSMMSDAPGSTKENSVKTHFLFQNCCEKWTATKKQ